MDGRHTFALFIEQISGWQSGSYYDLTDAHILHRLIKIVRLEIGDTFIAFDGKNVADAQITEIKSNHIRVLIKKIEHTDYIQPTITLAIGLLKKESFEDVLYNATELGVTTIQPLLTQKIHRNWWSDTFQERFHKIMVAAAEQAKNFTLPMLQQPISLQEFISSLDSKQLRLVCDPTGVSFNQAIDNSVYNAITLVIGPEGDITTQEKDILNHAKFNPVHLTPTILRSVQAVNVAVGIIRSL